jgi:hypothetical protein
MQRTTLRALVDPVPSMAGLTIEHTHTPLSSRDDSATS